MISDASQLLNMIERRIVTFDVPPYGETANGLWRYQMGDTVVEITTTSAQVFITRLRQLNLWDDL